MKFHGSIRISKHEISWFEIRISGKRGTTVCDPVKLSLEYGDVNQTPLPHPTPPYEIVRNMEIRIL